MELRVTPYKALKGFYLRLVRPDGSSEAIDDWSSREPLFATQAQAETWIRSYGAKWVRKACAG